MIPAGRTLILLGVLLILLGLIFSYLDFFSHLRLGRLPGDIFIKRGNFQLYFPITTCIAISLIVTIIIYLIRK